MMWKCGMTYLLINSTFCILNFAFWILQNTPKAWIIFSPFYRTKPPLRRVLSPIPREPKKGPFLGPETILFPLASNSPLKHLSSLHRPSSIPTHPHALTPEVRPSSQWRRRRELENFFREGRLLSTNWFYIFLFYL